MRPRTPVADLRPSTSQVTGRVAIGTLIRTAAWPPGRLSYDRMEATVAVLIGTGVGSVTSIVAQIIAHRLGVRRGPRQRAEDAAV